MKNDELIEELQDNVVSRDGEVELEDEDLIEMDEELADDGELDIEPDDQRDY